MTNQSEKSDTGVIRLDKLEEFIHYSAEILTPVIRTVNILTNDMDKLWLGHVDIFEKIKLAVIKNRRIQVRLLVGDPSLALKINHPLIPLIRKLSRFEARVIDQEMLEKVPMRNSFILVDRGGIIMKQSEKEHIGFAHFDDKQSVKNQLEVFDQYWRFSYTHSDLRHVYL